jgi:cell division protein FtsB
MTDKELIAALQKREHYYLNAVEGEHDGDMFRKAICRILDHADRIEALTAENFKLAAGSCDVEGGKVGDEHGHSYCALQAKIEALEAENEWLTAENEQWQVDYNEAVIDKLKLEIKIDPLVEAMSMAMCGVAGEDYTDSAAALRYELAKHGLKIVEVSDGQG